ncbi:hypothetical protein [Proteiniborus sp. MB09-C3]|uniref:hypothetical protein n=1 Tax=Proteiniborus sp. MB09-C3 TaxID=3050072 RepID=UPI002552AA83|nr:hypothetical protein [Proteiniborus sp. MB09-C3]WIV13756.1 hypothetical protein QO263_08685 [Proteiniborus sp. MB09-C3]
MKIKRIISSLAMLLCIGFFGGCSDMAQPYSTTDSVVSDVPAEILALRFDDYENMSIAEYRGKVWQTISTDEKGYFSLLDSVGKDVSIHDTNTDAYFVKYVLVPTVAEKWNEWSFQGSVIKDISTTEYTIHYAIDNAENILMDERNRAISEMVAGFEDVVNGGTAEQLSNEIEMQKALEIKAQKLSEEFSNAAFQIMAELSYRVNNAPSERILPNGETVTEQRGDVGTEADYRLLLSLKAEGYQEMSVEDFFQNYIELVQKEGFQDSYARVQRDISMNDIQVTLSDEERAFLTITLEATSQEFTAKFQNKSKTPSLRYRIEKRETEVVDGQEIPVFELFIDYILNYTVLDSKGLSVQERDTFLIGITDGIKTFIDKQTENELINGELTLKAETSRLEQQFNNTEIQANIDIAAFQAHDLQSNIQSLN